MPRRYCHVPKYQRKECECICKRDFKEKELDEGVVPGIGLLDLFSFRGYTKMFDEERIENQRDLQDPNLNLDDQRDLQEPNLNPDDQLVNNEETHMQQEQMQPNNIQVQEIEEIEVDEQLSMEGRQRRILLAILMFMRIQAFLSQPSPSTSYERYFQYLMDSCTQFIRGFDGRALRASPQIWSYYRPSTFMESTLLNSYSDNMFKGRLRLSKKTYYYVCQVLGPMLTREDTKMRQSIPAEKRICIALSRLATGNTIKEIADQYSVGYTTAQRAISEFCCAVKEMLHDLCIKWPSPERMKALACEFEKLRGIPYVVGAIDGSHLPIIAPHDNAQDYYNRKGFHSILLQLIVSSKGVIWDYDVGWAGSIHDWKLFESTEAGRRIQVGHLGNFCLVGDAAYPPRPWMLPPFKGHKDGLSKLEYNWNYLQSSTRMPVECAFGMLKSRFRILLKRNDTNLEKVPEIVATCLVLHNLCIRHGDSFDQSWVSEAKMELENAVAEEKKTKHFERKIKRLKVPETEIAKAAAYGIHRVNGVNLNPLEALARTLEDDPKEVTTMRENANKNAQETSQANAARRNALAKALFEKKTQELVHEQFGDLEHDSP